MEPTLTKPTTHLSTFEKLIRYTTNNILLVLVFALYSNTSAQTPPKFKVVGFYSASYDVAHISFAHEANKWFAQQAEKYNFQYDSTKNWDNLNAGFLANYQIVMFFDDSPASASQQAAFQKYMQNGGGFIGFHVCAFNTDPSSWDWYHNQFLATGAFQSNTWGPTTAVVKVEDNTHPASVDLPAKFTSAISEWYSWNNNLRKNTNIRILCSVDPSSFPLGSDPNQSWYSGYYPLVWANKNYKMLYCNFGHNDIDYANNNATKSHTFSNDVQNTIVINALKSFGGGDLTYAVPGKVEAENYDVMNGVKKETTSDTGGGQDIGYIDAGDWMDYKINVSKGGSYTIQFRVASMSGGGSLQLKSGATVLTAATIPSTGGWQTWINVTATVTLPAGLQTLRVAAVTAGFNFNSVDFKATVVTDITAADQAIETINVFPNPAMSNVTIRHGFQSDVHVEIYNETGTLMYEGLAVNGESVVPVDKWPVGVYVVKFKHPAQSLNPIKLIKW